MGRRSRAAADARINTAEARIQHILELSQSEVCNLNLPHLWNDNESFARDVDGMRHLDVTGKDEHEPITRPKPVILIHGAGEIRVELRRGKPEDVQAENGLAAVGVGVLR